MISELRHVANDESPVFGSGALETRSQLSALVEGAPSSAWLEGFLASERQVMEQMLAQRHSKLLADLQSGPSEHARATGGHVPQACGQKVVEGLDLASIPGTEKSSEEEVEILPAALPPRRPPNLGDLPDPAQSSRLSNASVILTALSEAQACEEGVRSAPPVLAGTADAPKSAWNKKSAWEETASRTISFPGTVEAANAEASPCQSRSACSAMTSDADTRHQRRPPNRSETKKVSALKQEMLLARRSFAGDNFFTLLVRDAKFELAVASIIMCNALVISFQIQYDGSGLGHELGYPQYTRTPEKTWPGGKISLEVMDYVFGVIFTMELIAKVLGQKLEWVKDPWNYLDAAIVGLWLIEKPLHGTLVLPADATILRTARLFRVLRLVKVLRTLQGFDALYLLLTTLKGCFWVLGWSIVLLFVTQMLIAMLFHLVLKEVYFHDESCSLEERKKLFEYFGTWTRAMLTMFEMTLANWPPVCRLLVENVSEWFSVFCVLHKLTMGFAVIGVINGVFMQETFKVAATDDKIMVRQREREVKVHTSKMLRLFRAADESGDDLIDLQEFKEIMQDKEILFWLSSMEITVRDPNILFMMLDADGDGYLTCEELVRGALALRGGAKSVDVLEMKAQITMIKNKLQMDDFKVQQPLYQGGGSSSQEQRQGGLASFVNLFKTTGYEESLLEKTRSAGLSNRHPSK